jgi:hypothetical protein
MKRSYLGLFFWTVIIAFFFFASLVNAQVVRIRLSPEVLYPTPPGFMAREESLRDWDHTFSRMIFSVDQNKDGTLAVAGYSFVWINGTPFLVQILWPRESAVHEHYPWLTYPPSD